MPRYLSIGCRNGYRKKIVLACELTLSVLWCSSADSFNLTDKKDDDLNEVYEPFLSSTTMNDGLRVTI